MYRTLSSLLELELERAKETDLPLLWPVRRPPWWAVRGMRAGDLWRYAGGLGRVRGDIERGGCGAVIVFVSLEPERI